MTDLVYTLSYDALLLPVEQVSGGAWGIGAYGVSPWGAFVTGGPPTLISSSPTIVDAEGGTVVAVAGNNFNTTAQAEVVSGGVVLASAVIADPTLDVTANRIFVGLPALNPGVYDLRIRTNNGDATLVNAIDARVFARDFKIETSRRKWGQNWAFTSRLLAGG